MELKSLGIRQDELKAALARERRPAVRRRLVAVSKLLEGSSIKRAAHAAKATPGSVERWLGQVRRSGFQSLLIDGRHGHAGRTMKPDGVEETRRQIATALAGPLNPQVRARLIAIDTVLSGRPIDEAAASARVLPNAVKSWLRAVTYDGIAPTLAKWEGRSKPRPRQLDADPAALRELAGKESNRPRRKQLLALALVAEGMNPHAAAFSTGATYNAVLRRLRRFQEEGISAFGDKKHSARARKLSLPQIQQIQAELLRNPNMGYRELPAFLWARFGVRYTFAGLRALLNREFGIVWRDGRFTQAPKTMTLDEGLRQQLGIAELQAALARTRDLRLRRRIIALIQLAQGWEPARVAFQVSASPETLENWVALYQRLGVRAFHPTSCKLP